MADRRELTADQRNLICRIIRDSEIVSGLVGKQEAITAAVADTGWSEDEIRQMLEDGIASSRNSDRDQKQLAYEVETYMANAELTNETAWWEPRLGKKLKDLSTPELNALAAGMDRCLEPALDSQADELLEKIKAELAERGNPLVTTA